MKEQEVVQFSHAVFVPNGDEYEVMKDILGHFSVGSVVSGQMLNAYLSIIPKSARIYVGTLDIETES